VNKIMGTTLGEKDCKELNAPALSNNELQHWTGDKWECNGTADNKNIL
jgi:hypothetical protein